MTRIIKSKSWGAYTVSADKANPKPWKKRAKDASEEIRWRKSKKRTVVTRAKARMMYKG